MKPHHHRRQVLAVRRDRHYWVSQRKLQLQQLRPQTQLRRPKRTRPMRQQQLQQLDPF